MELERLYGICQWENRDIEKLRWQQNWPIWELLILRHNNDTKHPQSKMKKILKKFCVLNCRSIELCKAAA